MEKGLQLSHLFKFNGSGTPSLEFILAIGAHPRALPLFQSQPHARASSERTWGLLTTSKGRMKTYPLEKLCPIRYGAISHRELAQTLIQENLSKR